MNNFGSQVGLVAKDLKAGDHLKGYCKLGY